MERKIEQMIASWVDENEEHSGNGTLACVAKGYKADAAICADGGFVIRTKSGGGIYKDTVINQAKNSFYFEIFTKNA